MAETSKARISRERKSLTRERLKELLHYDPKTGVFTMLVSTSAKRKAGSIAGYLMPSGHRKISIDCVEYVSTHLAFLYMTGNWPEDQVDHKDCNPDNNAWKNLRPCCEGENRRNTRAYKNNTSGFKGVYGCGSRWRAQISSGYRTIYLGTFGTREEASAAYAAKAKELFGEFARSS